MPQAKTITDAEFELLLLAVSRGRYAHRNRVMLEFLHLAGMRVGEVANLRVTDVLCVAGQIVEQLTLSADQTKGDRSRVVWLNAKLRSSIAEYLKHHRDGSLMLFTSQKRKHFTPNTLQAVITKLYNNAGFKGCSSHTGRRSFISKLASSGVNARVLQELAGHQNLATTQRYIDITDNMMRVAVSLA